MPITFRIRVNAPPEEVFRELADIQGHGEWANPKAGLQVQADAPGTVGVGSTFHSTQRFAGRDTGAMITVTAFEPPRRLAFDAVQQGRGKTQRFINEFRLEPQASGTLVERLIDQQPPNYLGIVFYPAIRADAMASLRRLKQRLESRS